MYQADLSWSTDNAEQFWRMADALQDQTVELASELFAFVERADPEQLRAILVQYRFFTVYYIPDIAILVARLQDGKLRSFMADVLFDELGRGDPAYAHPRLYDEFLRGLGCRDEELDALALTDNVEILDQTRRQLVDSRTSNAYAVGLRGMGGECVCQIYLAKLYEHVIRNPYVQQHRGSINWKFWDLHIGEHDIEHRLRTRQLINEEIIEQGGDAVAELGRGYQESMMSWGRFWSNVFDAVRSQDVRHTRIAGAVSFQLPAQPVRTADSVALS